MGIMCDTEMVHHVDYCLIHKMCEIWQYCLIQKKCVKWKQYDVPISLGPYHTIRPYIRVESKTIIQLPHSLEIKVLKNHANIDYNVQHIFQLSRLQYGINNEKASWVDWKFFQRDSEAKILLKQARGVRTKVFLTKIRLLMALP